MRDLRQAADSGNARAQLALDVFTTDIRRHLGSLLVELGGADVIVFTGGIGENQQAIRSTVCQDLEQLGIELDEDANNMASGESCISGSGSHTKVWVIPTNEELIVARQVCRLLEG
jgi:acetate kinase